MPNALLRSGFRRLLPLLLALLLGSGLLPAASNVRPPAPYAQRWMDDADEPALRAFRLWTTETAPADASERTAWLERGIQLARERRAVFAALIATDPASALARTVPHRVLRQLPAAVTAQVERRVGGTGTLEVIVVEPDSVTTRHAHEFNRLVSLNGEVLAAAVYGRRAAQATKEGIPLHGIALDGWIALHESPARALEEEEVITAAPLTLEIAGQPRRFPDPAALSTALDRLETAEAGIQPRPHAVRFQESTDGSVTAAPLTAAAAAGHSIGPKKVLIVPVDFSDLPGQPTTRDKKTTYTGAYCQSFADTELAPFYSKSSYGQTTLTNTVTPLLRLPRTAAYYATAQTSGGVFTGDTDIRTDTLAAATAAGFDPATFDRIMVVHSTFSDLPNTQVTYGGLGQFGGTFLWINAALDFRVTAHELGHTYGLNHANLWKVTDGNPISAAGASVEYKDYFDIMGGGPNDPRLDFNPWYKSLLGWTNSTQVQAITASGAYRVYAYDHANSTAAASELVALKIAKDSGTDYWVSLRRNVTDNSLLSHGAYIVWGYPTASGRSNLLNLTTPGGDHTDAPLAIGRGFSDPTGNVTIRITGEGGTAPNYYLDVEVTLGAATPAFAAPTIASSTGLANGSAIFKTSGSGNPAPAYQWQRLPAGQSTWANLDEAGFYNGTRTPTLTVRGTTTAMQGDQFRCVATNSAGAATSAAFTLNVAANLWETYSGAPGVRSSTNGSLEVARYAETNFLARDPAGNIYVTAAGNRTVRKITPEGVVSRLAGTEGTSGSTDGVGAAAMFYNPGGIASDSTGTLYVADTGIHSIRRVTAAGSVTTIAGLSGTSGATDGANADARFNSPTGLAIDASDNLYVADRNNHTIRKVTPFGVVTTFAGRAGTSGATNGVGGNARFSSPGGLAIDAAGNLYVGDSGNRLIRKIAPDGTVTTLAGIAGQSGSNDGPAASAKFGATLYGVSVSSDGTVYVGDTDNHIVRKISSGQVTTIGGLAGTSGSADGTPTDARFNQPRGLLADSSGGLLIADYGNSTLRRLKVAPSTASRPTLTLGSRSRYQTPGEEVALEVSVAGYPAPNLQWQRSVDAGVSWQNLANDATYLGATSARLTIASATAAMSGHQFRCIATSSAGSTVLPPVVLRIYTVTTFAGTAGTAGTADGIGAAARFRDPRGLALDAAGNLYVADRGNHTIRKITPAGVVSTVGGTAGSAGSVNGPASTARLSFPNSVAVSRDGTIIYVTDATHTVRRLATDGSVTLLAGAANTASFADGAGTIARFNTPSGLALETNGTLWVSDTLNQVMRRISPTGVVSTFAGQPGTSGYVIVDGKGTDARFRSPIGIDLAPDGALWVADASNHRVRRVASDATVTTLAGTNNWGSNDGNGSAAWFDSPNAIAVDSLGEGYVADTNNNLVRVVTVNGDVTAIAGSDVAAASTDGPGRNARFNAPRGIAVDPSGVIYVADSGNHTIRRFGPAAGGVAFTQTPPVLAASPVARSVAPGTATTLSVVVSSTATPSYQWYRDGTPLNGATNASLVLGNFSAADIGSYTVSATTAFGTVWSAAARVESSAPANPGRLVNLSLLTALPNVDDSFTMGTVIGGRDTSGDKPVLVRAAGPSLSSFGLANPLGDPRLEFFNGSTKIGENDDWGDGPALVSAFNNVGAFAFISPTSKDAAVFQPGIAPGAYSIRVTGANRTTGTVIAELYDSTPSNQYRASTPRLINVSVLKEIGTGFTVGFVIGGETPRTVLIRAVGPGLANVGVTAGFVADPRLTLFRGTTDIARNDDWGGSSALTAAMTSVGAFAIPATSRDAALLTTLDPGAYTVQIGSPANTTGIVIVEVYEVP